MTILQGCVAVLCILGLGGLLWMCYVAIQIADADEAERRRKSGR